MIAVLCSGALAAGAVAATLHVSVSPGTIHKGNTFKIRITGTFRQSELTGQAFLLSFIQYNTKPCEAGATKEFNTYGQPYFTATMGHSPFTRVDSFSAGSPGPRRVCAYLYPKKINPGSGVRSIAKAGHFYRVS